VEFVLCGSIFTIRNGAEGNQKNAATLIPWLSSGATFLSRITTSCFKTQHSDNEIMKSYDRLHKLHDYSKLSTNIELKDDAYAALTMCGRLIAF
jgi:hypothetical protein